MGKIRYLTWEQLKIYQELCKPLQKRRRHLEKKGEPSITEHSPQVNVHIGHGLETSNSKHPSC